MTGAQEAIVSVNAALPVPHELAAPITTLNVPLTIGEPEMTPLVEFTLKPLGRLLAENDVGLLLAVIV